MVITNQWYSRRDIKGALKQVMNDNKVELQNQINGIETKINGIETKINGIETKINGIETRMDAGFKATQSVIVEGAEATIKALKRDVEPLQQFCRTRKSTEAPEKCKDAVATLNKGEK